MIFWKKSLIKSYSASHAPDVCLLVAIYKSFSNPNKQLCKTSYHTLILSEQHARYPKNLGNCFKAKMTAFKNETLLVQPTFVAALSMNYINSYLGKKCCYQGIPCFFLCNWMLYFLQMKLFCCVYRYHVSLTSRLFIMCRSWRTKLETK